MNERIIATVIATPCVQSSSLDTDKQSSNVVLNENVVNDCDDDVVMNVDSRHDMSNDDMATTNNQSHNVVNDKDDVVMNVLPSHNDMSNDVVASANNQSLDVVNDDDDDDVVMNVDSHNDMSNDDMATTNNQSHDTVNDNDDDDVVMNVDSHYDMSNDIASANNQSHDTVSDKDVVMNVLPSHNDMSNNVVASANNQSHDVVNDDDDDDVVMNVDSRNNDMSNDVIANTNKQSHNVVSDDMHVHSYDKISNNNMITFINTNRYSSSISNSVVDDVGAPAVKRQRVDGGGGVVAVVASEHVMKRRLVDEANKSGGVGVNEAVVVNVPTATATKIHSRDALVENSSARIDGGGDKASAVVTKKKKLKRDANSLPMPLLPDPSSKAATTPSSAKKKKKKKKKRKHSNTVDQVSGDASMLEDPDQKVFGGWAKLVGDHILYYINKSVVSFGRVSAAATSAGNSSWSPDVVLPSNRPHISRKHARIVRDELGFHFQCLSKCGAFVNSAFVDAHSAPVKLHHRSLIQIGDILFYFLLPTNELAQWELPLRLKPRTRVDGKSTSHPTPLHPDERIRRPMARISQKWKRGERERLRASLLTFGFGDWERIHRVVGDNRTVNEIETFSLHMTAMLLKYNGTDLPALNGILRNAHAAQRGVTTDTVDENVVHWPSLAKNAKSWARRLALLFQLRTLLTLYDADELLDSVDRKSIKGRTPTVWWQKEHDRDLLLGIVRHGYGNFDDIREDPKLAFLPTLKEVVKKDAGKEGDDRVVAEGKTTTDNGSVEHSKGDDTSSTNKNGATNSSKEVNPGKISRLVMRNKLREAAGCATDANAKMTMNEAYEGLWPPVLGLVGRLKRLIEVCLSANDVDVTAYNPLVAARLAVHEDTHDNEAIFSGKRNRSSGTSDHPQDIDEYDDEGDEEDVADLNGTDPHHHEQHVPTDEPVSPRKKSSKRVRAQNVKWPQNKDRRSDVWTDREQTYFQKAMISYGVCGDWRLIRDFAAPILDQKSDHQMLRYWLSLMIFVYFGDGGGDVNVADVPVRVPRSIVHQLKNESVESTDYTTFVSALQMTVAPHEDDPRVDVQHEFGDKLRRSFDVFDRLRRLCDDPSFVSRVNDAAAASDTATENGLPTSWKIGEDDVALVKGTLKYGVHAWTRVLPSLEIADLPDTKVCVARLERIAHFCSPAAAKKSSPSKRNKNGSDSRRRKPTKALVRLTQSVRLMALGEISTHPAYHNSNFVYPVGFRSERIYPSLTGSGRSRYFSEILSGANGPEFVVTSSDVPGREFRASSPTAAWKEIEIELNKFRRRSLAVPRVDGNERFGLHYDEVKKRIREKMAAKGLDWDISFASDLTN